MLGPGVAVAGIDGQSSIKPSSTFEKVGVRSRRDLVKQLFFEQVLPTAGAASRRPY